MNQFENGVLNLSLTLATFPEDENKFIPNKRHPWQQLFFGRQRKIRLFGVRDSFWNDSLINCTLQ